MIGSFFVFFKLSLYAQTAEELKNQISGTSTEISKIEQEIKEYKTLLQKIGAEKNTLSRAVKELDLNAKKLGADIRFTDKKIQNSNLELSSIGDKIYYTSDTIKDTEYVIGSFVRDINEITKESLIESLVKKDATLGDTWRYIDQIMTTREALGNHINILKGAKIVV